MTIQTPTSEYITIHTASGKKYLNLGARQIAYMCQRGIFKTAFKPGIGGKGSKWLILRSEVIAHKINGHAQPQY